MTGAVARVPNLRKLVLTACGDWFGLSSVLALTENPGLRRLHCAGGWSTQEVTDAVRAARPHLDIRSATP